jgi:hypothetical protein
MFGQDKEGLTRAKPILDDELWKRIERFLPPPQPRRFRYPGRTLVENGVALTRILFVLRTGVGCEYLPGQWAAGPPGPAGDVSGTGRKREWGKSGLINRDRSSVAHGCPVDMTSLTPNPLARWPYHPRSPSSFNGLGRRS